LRGWTGWDEFAVNFVATATATIRIHLVYTGGAGTVYWHELQVLRAWGSGLDNGTIAPWSFIGAHSVSALSIVGDYRVKWAMIIEDQPAHIHRENLSCLLAAREVRSVAPQ
jgi:hypothetical protein